MVNVLGHALIHTHLVNVVLQEQQFLDHHAIIQGQQHTLAHLEDLLVELLVLYLVIIHVLQVEAMEEHQLVQ